MIRIRHAIEKDAFALARVMIEAIVATFKGLVPQQCLEWITPQESTTNWRRTLQPGALVDGECLFVAEDEGEIVGFAMGRRLEREPGFAGELRIIAVSPASQGRGVGRTLVREVAEHFLRHGIDSMIVHSMAVNPNCRFYEHLGARFLRGQGTEWNGVPLVEAVFGWSDLRSIH